MSMLRILHLEDDRLDADLVQATLAAGGLEAEVTRVDDRESFEAALESGRFDVILADYNLPRFDGLSAQILTAQLRPEIPFIFLSGSIGEELAVERLKGGATDYVLKDRMARLPSAVRRALAEAAERAERRRAEENVRRLNAELEQRVAVRTMELAESQRRLQAILDHSPAAISLKDASGRYIVANREFERVAGVGADALLGKTDADLFPPRLAATYRANDARVMEKQHGVTVEETFLQSDGVHVYHSFKFPVLDELRSPYALCAISIDITERKKTDDALKMARLEAERANRAKSEFLSRISHELRTPLNAILGFAQVLQLDDLGDEKKESVLQILRGGEHLLALINEVLDIARIEAGHLALSSEPVNAGDIVQLAMELVQPLAQQRDVALVVGESRAADAVILADRQRLNQILLNLLSNAVKYNRRGGRVTVGFEEVPGERLRIVVTDTGIGISPDKLERLFQPFDRLGAEQTPIEGTGLGLAVSRGLAEAMGGTLGVTSEVDRGSTFWIELALSDASHPRARAGSQARLTAPAEPRHATGVVLYIEDNQSNVRLMERVLERRPGVRLLHAPNGEDGLRLARDANPDLILLDLHLPDMSGEDVLRELWQDAALKRIPVAILSADAMPAQSRRLKAAGAIAYLTKPIDISQVMRTIDDSLGGPAPSAVEGPQPHQGNEHERTRVD
jgi:PAS domain S-box-containing protein